MLKSQQENKLNVVGMRILCWTSRHIRLDRIRNECIREKVGVAPIVETMVEFRIRWFGHMRKRFVKASIRRVGQIECS